MAEVARGDETRTAGATKLADINNSTAANEDVNRCFNLL
jgi:hypothetical protein